MKSQGQQLAKAKHGEGMKLPQTPLHFKSTSSGTAFILEQTNEKLICAQGKVID